MLLIASTAKAQNCDCRSELNFVRGHMEKNHPGFNSDIKDTAQPAYKAFVESLAKKIAADPTGKYCIAYLKQYLLYLKDHHINISGGSLTVREDSLPSVEAFLRSPFFLETERIARDSAMVIQYLQQQRDPGIEGIYKTPDGTYTIAFIKKTGGASEYAGTILESKTKLWQKDQVKVELRIANDSVAELYMYMRNHSLNYDQIRFDSKKPELPGWVKVFPQPSTTAHDTISNDLFSFKILDNNTTYLSIRNFSGRYATVLDSFYKAIMPEIMKRPHLIIDVRNNGGGSDMNYKALMPLLYTSPIIGDVVDYYATPGNIAAYTQFATCIKANPKYMERTATRTGNTA